jgi:hypothetical protein
LPRFSGTKPPIEPVSGPPKLPTGRINLPRLDQPSTAFTKEADQPKDSDSSQDNAVGPDDSESDSQNGDDNQEDGDESEDEEEDEESPPGTFFRPEWHARGPLAIESIYTGEVFNNAHGGISTKNATRYRGGLDLTLLLDLERAQLGSGGELFVYFSQTHGTTLSPQFVGDGQYYSNIDSGPRPQLMNKLGEYWYRHTSLDKALAFKIGQQDANADFAFCDLSGDFLNSSFVTIPTIPMPFWPNPEPTAMVDNSLRSRSFFDLAG